jgi:hypothetical protein
MPPNAIATGCADFMLSPERLSAALVALTIALSTGPIYWPFRCHPDLAWAP